MTHSCVQKARTAGGRRAKGRPRVRTAKIAHRTQRQDVNRDYTHLQATSLRRPQAVLVGPAGRALPRVPDPHALHRSMRRGRLRAEDRVPGQRLRDAPGARRSRRRRRLPTATRPPPSPPRSRRQTGCRGSPAADLGDHPAPRSQRRSRGLPRTPRSVRGRLPDATRTGSGLARPSRSVLLSPATQSDHTAAQTTRACKGRPAEVPLGREPSHPLHRHDVSAIGGSSRGVAVEMRQMRQSPRVRHHPAMRNQGGR